MPEILTESFCERCGTRYTFESNAPRGRRLGRFRTLGKGLRNFVMSDDTSLDEALAAARNDVEREATTQQLEAFHQTFNFCMSCRQYTCANCWNTVEGRCLTCAPHLGHEVLSAPFPTLDPALRPEFGNGSPANGHSHVEPLAWPVSDLLRDDQASAPDAGSPADEAAGLATADAAARPDVTPSVETGPEAAREETLGAEPVTEDQLAATASSDAGAIAESDRFLTEEPVQATAGIAFEPPRAGHVEEIESAPGVEATDSAAPEPELPAAISEPPATVEDRAATAAARTAALLARFRPGQSIDEALDAYEAARDLEDAATAAAAELGAPGIDSTAAPTTPAEPVQAEEDPAPEAAAPADATPEDAAPADAPIPGPTGQDRVEQPAWRMVAPDSPARTADGLPAVEPEPRGPLGAPPAQPDWPSTPQWPSSPQWPSAQAETDNLAALLSARRAATDDVWTASSRDIIAAVPAAGAQPAAVQSCVSCGLSLSATARFCRRCGTRQG